MLVAPAHAAASSAPPATKAQNDCAADALGTGAKCPVPTGRAAAKDQKGTPVHSEVHRQAPLIAAAFAFTLVSHPLPFVTGVAFKATIIPKKSIYQYTLAA
jgi:hypothetical protein